MAPTKGGHKHERNLRRKSKGELNYMFATLVIEKDNDSDEDFVLERIDDEDEEENLDNPDPEPEKQQEKCKPSKLRKHPAVSEKTNESVKKGRFSPHEVLPLLKKHKGESRAIFCAVMSSMTVVEQR
ncbi:hypothetical protein PInf_003418 [Phytophthora infestans]|nr:hypothetical protein PInf_003418 [Phytophthora infestans]